MSQGSTTDGKTVLAWTVCGPLACMAVALGYTVIAFWGFGTEVRLRATITAIVLPLALGAPLFLYVSLKLGELARVNRKLAIMAATDGLTACLNRAAFSTLVDTRLERVIASGQRPHGALFIIDVDNFKQINDRFGHHNGDTALTLIAQAIRNSVRAGDSVGRMGGEEFGVFLPGIGRPVAERVAERLRLAVEKLVFIAEGEIHPVSVSVGGVIFEKETDFQTLFKEADERLYAAKRAGRNRVFLASQPVAEMAFAISGS